MLCFVLVLCWVSGWSLCPLEAAQKCKALVCLFVGKHLLLNICCLWYFMLELIALQCSAWICNKYSLTHVTLRAGTYPGPLWGCCETLCDDLHLSPAMMDVVQKAWDCCTLGLLTFLPVILLLRHLLLTKNKLKWFIIVMIPPAPVSSISLHRLKGLRVNPVQLASDRWAAEKRALQDD